MYAGKILLFTIILTCFFCFSTCDIDIECWFFRDTLNYKIGFIVYLINGMKIWQ